MYSEELQVNDWTTWWLLLLLNNTMSQDQRVVLYLCVPELNLLYVHRVHFVSWEMKAFWYILSPLVAYFRGRLLNQIDVNAFLWNLVIIRLIGKSVKYTHNYAPGRLFAESSNSKKLILETKFYQGCTISMDSRQVLSQRRSSLRQRWFS